MTTVRVVNQSFPVYLSVLYFKSTLAKHKKFRLFLCKFFSAMNLSSFMLIIYDFYFACLVILFIVPNPKK